MSNTTSTKKLDDALRAKYMELVKGALTANGEEILVTGSNEYAVPCVDTEGNEKFIVLTFKVPKGTREGEAYDGYEEAQGYADKLADKAQKAAEKAKAKEAKIARDAKLREEKAKAKKAKAEG